MGSASDRLGQTVALAALTIGLGWIALPTPVKAQDLEGHGPVRLVSLTPYAPDGSYARLWAATESRSCLGVPAKIDALMSRCMGRCEGSNALALLHAKALLCTGDSKGALAELRALDQHGYPGMEATVRTLLVRAGRLRHEQTPLPLAPSLATDPAHYLSYALRAASERGASGDIKGALADLDGLERQVGSPWMKRSVAMTRAKLLERSGQGAEASKIYVSLWRQSPTSKAAGDLARRVGRLRKLDGSATLSQDDYLDQLTRAALRGKKRSAKAATAVYARRFGVSPVNRRAIKGYVRGIRLESQRHRDSALRELKRAEKAARDPLLKARIRHAKAKVLRRLNRDDEAIATYLAVVEDTPTSGVSADALFQGGRLEAYLGHTEEALGHLNRFVRVYPDSPLMPEVMWTTVWTSWLAGDDATGLELATQLIARYGDHRDRSGLPLGAKARYWRARMLERSGQRAEALDALRFVMERFPATYYAALAYHRIASMGVDPRALVPFQSSGVAGRPPSEAELVGVLVPGHPRALHSLELWKTGRRSEAKRELLAQLNFSDPPRAVVELLSTLQRLDGNLPLSHWNAGHYGDFAVAPYRGNRGLWTLAYPVPDKLAEIARQVGAEVEVDPYMALAVMRRESAFKSNARSSAGAIGLMQLMPATARALNKRLYGRRGPSRRSLRKPEVNIRLGMAMLGTLADTFDDNLPLMIAAYNAGPGVASRWYRTFRDQQTDALVELMTYPGTVAYVKQVIGATYAYRLLYGDGTPPPIPIDLPSELGVWGAGTAARD